MNKDNIFAHVVIPIDQSIIAFEKLLVSAFNEFFNKNEFTTRVDGINYVYCKNACLGISLSVNDDNCAKLILYVNTPSNEPQELLGRMRLRLKNIDQRKYIVKHYHFKLKKNFYAYDGKKVIIEVFPTDFICYNNGIEY